MSLQSPPRMTPPLLVLSHRCQIDATKKVRLHHDTRSSTTVFHLPPRHARPSLSAHVATAPKRCTRRSPNISHTPRVNLPVTSRHVRLSDEWCRGCRQNARPSLGPRKPRPKSAITSGARSVGGSTAFDRICIATDSGLFLLGERRRVRVVGGVRVCDNRVRSRADHFDFFKRCR